MVPGAISPGEAPAAE